MATWTVSQIEGDNSDPVSGLSGVAKVLHWQCTGVEGDHSSRSYGTVSLPNPDPNNFVQLDDVTDEQAVTWAKEALGAEQVTACEASIEQQIEEKRNPTTFAVAPKKPAAKKAAAKKTPAKKPAAKKPAVKKTTKAKG